MSLESDFKFFLAQRPHLLKEHEGDYVVIKGGKILGFFKDEMEAIKETSKNHEVGSFIVQLCDKDPDSYTQTFHSRVAFREFNGSAGSFRSGIHRFCSRAET